MADIIELYNSKFVNENNVGGNNFFNNEKEIAELNNRQRKFNSNVDYSDPANFVIFSSAEEVYKNAISYINSNYPYDGTTSDKLKWINSLSDVEYNIFINEYPKTVGHISLSGSQYIEVYSPVKTINSDIKGVFNNQSDLYKNTTIDFKDGFTFESWIKFEENDLNTNILTITALTESDGVITDIELLSITKEAGIDPKFVIQNEVDKAYFSTIVPENEWHHYAFCIKSGSAKLYIDGVISDTIDNLQIAALKDTYIFVPLGLMLVPLAGKEKLDEFNKSAVFSIGGGDKTCFDDCRMWNGERTTEKIGRYWFTNVDGNDVTDTNNSNLIFYYKFNEGWDDQYRFLCLDNSGRKNNAEIKDFSIDCVKNESAIDLYMKNKTNSQYFNGLQFFSTDNRAADSLKLNPGEIPDVSYGGMEYSEIVKAYYSEKILTGSLYDQQNFHSLYNKFPSWVIMEEEEKEVKHLKQLIQIVCYYFDDLYLKIKEIVNYKEINYETDLDKIYPFYDKILSSMGFDLTDLFSELSELEKISSRAETHLFSADVNKVKNAIYKNIYNNLSYILKSKGTEKAIKNFLRTYGVNDNLVRISLYPGEGVFDVTENLAEVVVKKKVVKLTQNNIIRLSNPLEQPEYFTLEASFMLPSSLQIENNTTSSLFGLTSSLGDEYYVTFEKESDDVTHFSLNKLSGSTLQTVKYNISNYNIYDGTVWNLVLRKKPDVDTLIGATANFTNTLELYGVNYNTHIKQEFSCSLKYDDSSYLTYFIGCKKDKNNATTHKTNSKFLYCNFWADYLNNNVIISHNKDILNYGVD